MNKQDIIFDLSKNNYSDSGVIDDKAFVHRSKMGQLMDIWNNLFENAKNSIQDGKGIASDSHNTISILANRGAGKTSFLMTFRDRIQSKYSDDILMLPMIDPSMMETKQHPFINIIAYIKAEVDNKISDSNNDVNKDNNYSYKIDVDNKYKKLLLALPFIDGIGKDSVYSNWDDVEYISSRGMDNALASNELRVRFSDYVLAVLRLLNKKVLFISFDDVDTDFCKGYQILEVIRKYLNIPSAITVLTGDIELFSKLVRREFWNHFTRSYLFKEAEVSKHSSETYSAMIDQLENQYMVKVLKPEYRIQLRTLKEYTSDSSAKIYVKFSYNQEPEELSQCYQKIVELTSNQKGKIAQNIISFLMSQTLRIQIRIIALIKEIKDNIFVKGSVSHSTKKKISERLLQIYWNDINQNTNNANKLLRESNNYTIELLNFLIKTETLSSNVNFLPEMGNESLNKAFFAIGARFNILISEDISNIFDYWFRISYTRMMLDRIGQAKDIDDATAFIEFSQLHNDINMTKSIGYAHAYCNMYMKQLSIKSDGYIPGITIIDRKQPLESFDFTHRIATLPMLGILDKEMNVTMVASIFHLLSVLRDIFRYCQNTEKYSDDIALQINKLSQFRNYHEPNDKDIVFFPINKTEREYDYIRWEYSSANSVMLARKLRSMYEWTKFNNIEVSVQLLDRIFTRFYYTLINIDNRHEYKNAADAMSQYVVAFLNSILVEESIENGQKTINMDNMANIEHVYLDNYIKTTSKRRKLSFYTWMEQCPLLDVFIDPQLKEYCLSGNNAINEWEYYKLKKESKILNSELKKLRSQKKEYSDAETWMESYRLYRIFRERYESEKDAPVVNKSKENDYLIQMRILKESLLQSVEKPQIGIFLDIDMDRTEIIQISRSVSEELAILNENIRKKKERLANIEAKIKSIGLVKEDKDMNLEQDTVYSILSQYNLANRDTNIKPDISRQ